MPKMQARAEGGERGVSLGEGGGGVKEEASAAARGGGGAAANSTVDPSDTDKT